jgi:hypothetical protein
MWDVHLLLTPSKTIDILRRMGKIYKYLAYSLIFLLSVAGRCLFADEPPPLDQGGEMLVLRNGQILEGRITKLKDRYLVDLPDGEIQIRNAEVDFVCRSLEEGFQQKRAAIQSGDWREHLELARWCLKHRMNDHADAELSAAERVSPNNPMIAALRRQAEPIPEVVKSEKTAPLDDSVTNEELDEMIRGLPPKTMEVFTQKVQPVLINNCTASGCHGSQSTNNLRLFRVSAGETAHKRLTQRNLYSVMQFVNRENPTQSPLITVPINPHGSATRAIFNEKHAGQYLNVAEWLLALDSSDQSVPTDGLVDHVSTSKNPSVDLPGDSSKPPHLLSREAQQAKPLTVSKNRRPPKLDSENSEDITQTSYQEPPEEFLQSPKAGSAPTAPPIKGGKPTDLKSLPTSKPKVQRGAPIPKSEPKDPFDPELFNRRYHKEEAPKEGVATSGDTANKG